MMEREEGIGEMKTEDLRFAAFAGRTSEGAEKLCILEIGEKRILRVYTQTEGELQNGDIYMGRVEKSSAGIGACFADIGKAEPVFLAEKLTAGTELPLRIKSPARGGKRAMACSRIPAELAGLIAEKAAHAAKGSCLYHVPTPLEESLKRCAGNDRALWITADEALYLRAKALAPEGARLKLHTDRDITLCALYGLSTKLSRILSMRVNLPSGGELVIQETEAMVVVDVNSAKAVHGKEKEKTILQLNLEAAEELAYQIEARRLSGILMVDFVNMKEKESETILLSRLKELSELCEPRYRVEDITKLGIVELSRRRTEDSIRAEKDFLNSTILTK